MRGRRKSTPGLLTKPLPRRFRAANPSLSQRYSDSREPPSRIAHLLGRMTMLERGFSSPMSHLTATLTTTVLTTTASQRNLRPATSPGRMTPIGDSMGPLPQRPAGWCDQRARGESEAVDHQAHGLEEASVEQLLHRTAQRVFRSSAEAHHMAKHVGCVIRA